MKHYLFSRLGRAGMAMSNFWVICSLFMVSSTVLNAQTIDVLNPCTCRDFPVNTQGNATTLDNGQFIETIEVTSNPGEVWYISALEGFFDATSPQPPFTPLQYITGPAGEILTENPAGRYSLEGIHVDALGYEISVTNGTDTLTFANACAYPNPVITSDLREGYCQNSGAITLSGNAGNAMGTGIFDLLSEDMTTVIAANINSLDPANLPLGIYFLRFTFDEEDNPILPCTNCNPGCVQTIFHEFEIVEPPFSIACNDDIEVALGGECQAEVLPDMLLEGDQDYSIFDVEILLNGVNIGNTVDESHIGMTLMAGVIDICTGLECWTTIFVQDNTGPVFDCPSQSIQLACTENPDNVFPPAVTDACEGTVEAQLIFEEEENFACGDATNVLKRITRTYQAEDSEGNLSFSNCTLTIEVLKASLSEVILPPNLDDNALPALECPSNNTTPSVTGFPTINGLPVDGDDLCTISATFTDEVLPGCGGTSKIQRTWTIYDWCSPTSPLVNPILYTQTIKIGDSTPPVVVAPQDITVSAFNNDCTGDYNFPAAQIEDACSSFNVSLVTSQGLIFSNGGIVTGFPIGTHVITYSALDDCGNTGSDQMILTVVDDVEPTPVCDEITTVVLNQNGEGSVDAIDLDDGSLDNCTGVSFLIQVMDSNMPFTPSLDFDCSDAGDTVMVVVQISDLNGNANTCEVEVIVENSSPASISCPANITVDCNQGTEVSVTGMASASSNCGSLNVVANDIVTNLNACGIGFIVREFSTMDDSQEVASCQQTITVASGAPLQASDILFPSDYTTADCANLNDLQPGNLPTSPTNFSVPTIGNNDACVDPEITFTDQTVSGTGNICFRIERTWLVIDLCNPATQFSGIQMIDVIDQTAPVLSCPQDFTINIQDGCDTSLVLPLPTIEECSNSLTIVAVSPFGSGTGPFNDVGVGENLVTIFVNDNCGNQSNCSYEITISESVVPQITCDDVPPITIGADLMTVIPADYFTVGSSDDCTSPEDLQFSFSPNPADSTFTVDCDDGGVLFVTIWATDASGNQSLCFTDVVIDTDGPPCGNLLFAVNGTVFTEEDYPVQDVTLMLNGADNPNVLTDSDGEFTFLDIEQGSDITLTPEKDLNIANGISALDLAIITKHILNIQPITSPYKLIAADVNKNNFVSTTDVVALRKIILQIEDSFPNGNQSWRFVDADFEFANPLNPFAEVFPEIVSINNLTEDAQVNFIGIKIGDVNCSANPLELLAADDRSQPTFDFSVENKHVNTGDEFWVTLSNDGDLTPQSLQFGLSFSDDMEYLEIKETDWLKTVNIGTARSNQKELRFCWFDENKAIGKDLIQLKFKAHKAGYIRDFLQVNEAILVSEATFSETGDQLYKVNLKFGKEETNWQVSPNYPNPFTNATSVQITVPERTECSYRLLDILGTVLLQKELTLERGVQPITLNREQFSNSGIYFLEVNTEFGKQVVRMVFKEEN